MQEVRLSVRTQSKKQMHFFLFYIVLINVYTNTLQQKGNGTSNPRTSLHTFRATIKTPQSALSQNVSEWNVFLDHVIILK